MMLFDFIVWNVSPEILPIGKLSLRWYGILFVSGFLIGQQILIRIYKNEGKSEKHVETLTIYMLIATIVGARLGHCLFYQPDYFLAHPLEILYIWEGGLASHGATIGILLAIYIYSKKQTDQSYLYVLDRLVITIALAGCLIRIGNLMNSEIYGKQTDLPYGFVFVHGIQAELQERYDNAFSELKISNSHRDSVYGGKKYEVLDLSLIPVNAKREGLANFIETKLNDHLHYGQNTDLRENLMVPDGELKYNIVADGNQLKANVQLLGVPRHPTQIYEAGLAFLLFLLLFFTYEKHKAKTPEGRLFGMFVFILFSSRFLVEYLKAPQVDFENDMTLNMGQLLSLPFIIAGLFILIKSYTKKGEII